MVARRPFSGGSWLDPAPEGFTLVFEDTFSSGSGPDYTTKYYPVPTWGSGDAWGPGQANDYEEDAALLQGSTETSGIAGFSHTRATVSGGKLHLNAVNSSQRFGAQTFPHSSSMIRTHESWLFGIFEAKVTVPSGTGCWPSFWLMPEEYDTGAIWEVDIFEFLNSEPATKARLNCHWGTEAAHQQSQSEVNGNWTGEHTYRLIWTPTSYEWVFDGVSVRTFTHGVHGNVNQTEPMQILMQLSMGGSFPGSTDGTTPWPIDMPIDDLRVYQET